MPRKSLVEQLVYNQPEEIKAESLGSESILVLYRFNKSPSHRFYSTLERLNKYIAFNRLQRGVLKTTSLKYAYALIQLIEHYGGDSKVFNAQALEFLS
jgi:hypothetical protein